MGMTYDIKSLCFTGHRILAEEPKALFNRLCNILEDIIKSRGITVFYAGGAIGFDTVAAKAVLHLRDDLHYNIKLCLILPCSNDEQTRDWSTCEKFEFKNILGRADTVEYTSKDYHPSCMKIRNKALVDHATDICLCYLEEGHKSGTSQTVNFAKEKGLEIINIYKKG